MLTVTLRRTFSAMVLAALLTTFAAACGDDKATGGGPDPHPTDDAPSSPSVVADPPGSPAAGSSAPGSPAPGNGPVATRVVYFSSMVRGAAWHEVLHNRGELAGFAKRFAANDPKAAAAIASSGAATDFSRQVLVGWTEVTGCSAATAAMLTVSGDRVSLHVDQPKPPPECFAADQVTVVFEVPKERIPARPVFG